MVLQLYNKLIYIFIINSETDISLIRDCLLREFQILLIWFEEMQSGIAAIILCLFNQ